MHIKHLVEDVCLPCWLCYGKGWYPDPLVMLFQRLAGNAGVYGDAITCGLCWGAGCLEHH